MSAKVKRVLSEKTVDGLPVYRHVTEKKGRPSEDVLISKGHYVPMAEYRKRKAAEARKAEGAKPRKPRKARKVVSQETAPAEQTAEPAAPVEQTAPAEPAAEQTAPATE